MNPREYMTSLENLVNVGPDEYSGDRAARAMTLAVPGSITLVLRGELP